MEDGRQKMRVAFRSASDRHYQRLSPGLRWTLTLINAFHLISGLVIVGLGVQVDQRLDALPQLPEQPLPASLWWLGLLPLTIGFLGFVCCLVGKRIWVLVWVMYNLVSTAGGYAFFTVSGCLQPEAYGVNIHIYAHCHQMANTCFCSARDNITLLTSQPEPCETIWYVTTVYLAVISLFTLCLAGFAISAILGAVASCCLQWCGQEKAEIEASVISNAYAGKNYSTFVTEYVPPNATRTVIVNNHASTKF